MHDEYNLNDGKKILTHIFTSSPFDLNPPGLGTKSPFKNNCYSRMIEDLLYHSLTYVTLLYVQKNLANSYKGKKSHGVKSTL